MTRTTTVRNGIDVDQLLATIETIKDDPQVGSFTFRASSRWEEGTHNVGAIGRFLHAGQEDESRQAAFTVEGDEPPVLLGRNKAPNAVELLLQALGFCYAVGYVANAAARGIEVTSMEYDVEGDVDVRTFLGLEGPRAGFTRIRVAGRVSSPNATDEQLQELCRHVQDTSPVRDCLANPIPVTTTLETAH
ncbi:OsmC family protein [Haloactinomyces albus]|uniref:OsmC-like protein n=1 Tax=Haloactinomyces albus TaxID=1352928 RepID=A0AAE3ZAK8_9ACTN|nr:OsmC family protein [Haloactinomyces albus]MDR7300091.1 putative OsmC-like protein [Haloactinomyces albus]